ncbi:MAG: aminopeptidase [Myxococcota bacterium]
MSSKSKHKRLQMKRKIKHRQKKKVLRRELAARRAEAAKE